MTFFENLRDRMSKRNRYRRTLAELNSLSTNEANDLGISPSDFTRIARDAVYGN